MNFDITNIADDLKRGAVDAAKEVAKNFLVESAADAVEFVSKSLPYLERYMKLYLDDKINADELKSLVLGLKYLAEMNALTVAGMASIEIENTRNTILKTITSIALGSIKSII